MKFKIDLKIFLITFLFFYDKSNKNIHNNDDMCNFTRIRHLIMGIILGMKPEKN